MRPDSRTLLTSLVVVSVLGFGALGSSTALARGLPKLSPASDMQRAPFGSLHPIDGLGTRIVGGGAAAPGQFPYAAFLEADYMVGGTPVTFVLHRFPDCADSGHDGRALRLRRGDRAAPARVVLQGRARLHPGEHHPHEQGQGRSCRHPVPVLRRGPASGGCRAPDVVGTRAGGCRADRVGLERERPAVRDRHAGRGARLGSHEQRARCRRLRHAAVGDRERAVEPDVAASGFTFVPSFNMCTQAPGGLPSSCTGDSGGPLVESTPAGPVAVGITSYGSATCGASPDFLVRTSSIQTWVASVLGGTPPPPMFAPPFNPPAPTAALNADGLIATFAAPIADPATIPSGYSAALAE